MLRHQKRFQYPHALLWLVAVFLTTNCGRSTTSDSLLSGEMGCTIAASTASPTANQVVKFDFKIAGSWGAAPYKFTSFQPGRGAFIVQQASMNASDGGVAYGRYQYSGLATASVQVIDRAGTLNSCSTQVVVSGGISIGSH